MNKLFLILALASLACGMQTPKVKATYVQAETEVSTAVKMTVTAYQLNVRDDANGQVVEGFYLIQGDSVVIYDELTKGDINWCRITPVDNAPRWVACGWLKGEE